MDSFYKQFPKSSVWIGLYCKRQIETGKHELVLPILLEAVNLYPNKDYLHFTYGLALSQSENIEKACQQFLKAKQMGYKEHVDKEIKDLIQNTCGIIF